MPLLQAHLAPRPWSTRRDERGGGCRRGSGEACRDFARLRHIINPSPYTTADRPLEGPPATTAARCATLRLSERATGSRTPQREAHGEAHADLEQFQSINELGELACFLHDNGRIGSRWIACQATSRAGPGPAGRRGADKDAGAAKAGPGGLAGLAHGAGESRHLRPCPTCRTGGGRRGRGCGPAGRPPGTASGLSGRSAAATEFRNENRTQVGAGFAGGSRATRRRAQQPASPSQFAGMADGGLGHTAHRAQARPRVIA